MPARGRLDAAHVLAAALAAAVGAQEPAATASVEPTDPSLATLIEQVRTAHQTEAAMPVRSFRADLRIEELARAAEEHRGQIELSVRFLDWRHPDTDRPYPLIRYRQTDSARAIEQGRDREDYWSVVDGKSQDMRSREMATDLEHARRNLKLARQLVRFLDPSTVLADLQEPSPPTKGDLVQGRAARIPCWVVEGRLPSFPMRQASGDDGPVRARLYVARGDHRFVGLQVESAPSESTPVPPSREFVLFSEPRPLQGRVVPTRLVHFAVDDNGKRNAQLAIDLATLDLDPKLDAEDFDRPR